MARRSAQQAEVQSRRSSIAAWRYLIRHPRSKLICAIHDGDPGIATEFTEFIERERRLLPKWGLGDYLPVALQPDTVKQHEAVERLTSSGVEQLARN